MKNILILGAGLSTASLIDYLLDHADLSNWSITVGDADLDAAQTKINGHPRGKAIQFDLSNELQRSEEIRQADVVISMLPARFHPIVAKACLELGKPMLTASYVSTEMKQLDEEVKRRGLTFLNELGVDPGIDHMSAMRIIDQIHAKGGVIHSFESYTGGLIAPESDTNPWNYKFTWNPRNVVLAGQGMAAYISNTRIKYLPYHQVFRRLITTSILDLGEFEGYANRDSLCYRDVYNLPNIPTMIRGTLRRPGFCEAWDIFVQLGMTDDSAPIVNETEITHRQFVNSFLPYHETEPVEFKLARLFGLEEDGVIMKKLAWLGLFSHTKITLRDATPARVLQSILEEKWRFEEEDNDMIVMQHIFKYELNGAMKKLKSSLVVIGKDHVHTAMAITVGTPLAIATKLLLENRFSELGVLVPTKPQFYNPILDELQNQGIEFIEEESDLSR